MDPGFLFDIAHSVLFDHEVAGFFPRTKMGDQGVVASEAFVDGFGSLTDANVCREFARLFPSLVGLGSQLEILVDLEAIRRDGQRPRKCKVGMRIGLELWEHARQLGFGLSD